MAFVDVVKRQKFTRKKFHRSGMIRLYSDNFLYVLIGQLVVDFLWAQLCPVGTATTYLKVLLHNVAGGESSRL